MTILLLVLAIILTIVGVIICEKIDEDLGFLIGGFSGIITVVLIIVVTCLGISVRNLSVIDDKIAMYQEENTKIEEQVATAVQNFQDHESKVFENATAESAITLVSLYPELKSDTLVQSQIEIYVENNEKIKELKEKKINGDVYRWWLYFGGKEK